MTFFLNRSLSVKENDWRLECSCLYRVHLQNTFSSAWNSSPCISKLVLIVQRATKLNLLKRKALIPKNVDKLGSCLGNLEF